MDFRIIWRMLTPHGLRIDTDQDAGSALRDRMTTHRPQHCVPPLQRCRQGLPRTYFEYRLQMH
jgi:hypothetical protein